MDISATPQATAAAPQPAADRSVVSSDFETFLKMLTTQLENQDPLNPVESTDFAVQLATFSGVEQQVRTNEILAGLAGQMAAGGMAEFASWVGMEARVAAPASYTGQPLTVLPQPAPAADAAQLLVRDATGTVVQRLDISVSAEPFTWSGYTDTGIPLPDGAYGFEVESFAAGESIGRAPAEIYATVTEARLEEGGMMLVLDSGAEVAAGAVSALRAPGT